LLEIRGLRIDLQVGTVLRTVVRDVSLDVPAGGSVALVGESGSGKSMTARAILRLLPAGAGVGGQVRFDGRDVAGLTDPELRRYRADDVGIVFQDPRAHVNPVRRVGDFLTEPLVRVRGMDRQAARHTVAGILDEVGVPDPEHRFRQYPHELSGGLLQRMMIASVVAMRPRLIVADEPTTALDVTTQADVMAILAHLRRSRGLALLLITHDLDLAAAVCERAAVMYAGSILEDRPAQALLHDPRHPYSAALASSRPGQAGPGERLLAVPGRPLSASEAPPGCTFAPRCHYAQPACRQHRPDPRPLPDGAVACLRADELRGSLLPSTLDVSTLDVSTLDVSTLDESALDESALHEPALHESALHEPALHEEGCGA
jgi:oligopeptide/dipeptide ABC transporter ATP-binding protein